MWREGWRDGGGVDDKGLVESERGRGRVDGVVGLC